MKDLNPCKKDLNRIYKMKLLVEDQAQGFKSSSFGFESPLTVNSNSTVKIRILELWIQIPPSTNAFNAWLKWLITPDFKKFLFHNG